MKYLFIDASSVEELINNRSYQSPEFAAGKTLISFVRGAIPKTRFNDYVAAIFQSEGGFVVAPNSESKDFIVFDLEEMPDLCNLSDTDLLLAFQKTLRFCKKLWEGLTPSKHERILSDSKAVVFPYPIGLQTSLRISIDRNPYAKRRAKRESGQAYLVYKFGDNEGAGPTEVPRFTNFRKASEALSSTRNIASNYLQEQNNTRSNSLSSLAVTSLNGEQRTQLHETGLENWQRWLTSSQLDFVNAPLSAPHRIEGPAGTGKTLCLILKAITVLSQKNKENHAHRALFVTHSQATKTAIENLFATNGGEGFVTDLNNILPPAQSISITTLHELCALLLRREISDSELVDRDAYESKLTQKLYAIEAVERSIKNELPSHQGFLSPEFFAFLEKTDKWAIAEMLQHEISVQIKGRAEQDLGKYKKLPALKFGLPTKNDSDRTFIFLMYEEYQRELEGAAQFDTDDVVLSAMSQLRTPIWRRRRSREGYDSIFIDETHLFNLNELSIFHKLTRSENSQPIAYSVDRSQALGDRGWTNEAFENAFDPENLSPNMAAANVRSIFRCSPEIIDLAFSVTASGATLFTNFHNPLTQAVSAFSAEEEKKCKKPVYHACTSDSSMMQEAFILADAMAKAMSCPRGDIAIIAFGDNTFEETQKIALNEKRPLEVVKSRGDIESVERAKQGNKFLLSAPEFVGGLEFCGVVLVGVDAGRVPPISSGAGESQAFLDYAAHQRLYVAITRAKYQVEILGTKARGISSPLQSAKHHELLDYIE